MSFTKFMQSCNHHYGKDTEQAFHSQCLLPGHLPPPEPFQGQILPYPLIPGSHSAVFFLHNVLLSDARQALSTRTVILISPLLFADSVALYYYVTVYPMLTVDHISLALFCWQGWNCALRGEETSALCAWNSSVTLELLGNVLSLFQKYCF